MSEIYKDYELNEYLQSDWYAVENALFKSIIDKLPGAADDLVTSEHTHYKLVSIDDGVIDPAVQVDALGQLIVGQGMTAADALLHVYLGDSGTTFVSPPTGAAAVFEGDDDLSIYLLAPYGTSGDTSIALYFGSNEDTTAGSIRYTPLDVYTDQQDYMEFFIARAEDPVLKLSMLAEQPFMTLADDTDIICATGPKLYGNGCTVDIGRLAADVLTIAGKVTITEFGDLISEIRGHPLFGIGLYVSEDDPFGIAVNGNGRLVVGYGETPVDGVIMGATSTGLALWCSAAVPSGCVINSDADLALDADRYFRIGHDAVGTTTNTVVVYGKTPGLTMNNWLKFKDKSGVVYYVPATSISQDA